MLQLAFFPSTIFFEILPTDVCLVHSFELLYSVLPYRCTVFYNVAIFPLGTCYLQCFSITSSAAMDVLDVGSCSREQVFLWDTYHKVGRLCHCFFKRES